MMTSDAGGAARCGSILVVDDDAHIRSTVRGILEDEGWRVVVAADGEEALSLLQGGLRPQLILLDLTMPGMDGVEFMARRRRDPALVDIPVYLFSATQGAADKAAGLGAAGMVPKPAQLDQLLAILERHQINQVDKERT